jgi:C-terminal of NADH-ubiquinone oxidoreductase 21 kDa subunit/NADH-ubiquinone oxidoreductase complex I, 21 kDa subunit
MRPSDYAVGVGTASIAPLLFAFMEKASPTYVGRGAFTSVMRLNVAVGIMGGFFMMTSRSTSASQQNLGLDRTKRLMQEIDRFYGVTENAREVEMDMREMVDKVKAGKPLYGESQLTEYMQGVAARNSRYTGTMLHLIPMFNWVNHPHVSNLSDDVPFFDADKATARCGHR